MLTIGRRVLRLLLLRTTSTLMLPPSTRRTARITVGMVSPSAAFLCAAVGADLYDIIAKNT